MADPFRPDTKSQLLREAQVGLSIVAILLVLLVYVAFYRITGRGKHIPDHVRNAPIAQLVWPGESDQRVAVREIEMTAQEFRDTRMPKATFPNNASVAPSTAARAKVPTVLPNNKVESRLRSPYRPIPSPVAMAEKRTSRPEVPLDKPNFSPNPNLNSQSFQPIATNVPDANVGADFPIAQAASKTIAGPSKLTSPASKTFTVNPSDPQFEPKAIAKPESQTTKIDSKVELASLESDDNGAKVQLPDAANPFQPKPAVFEASPANAFQPKPADSNLEKLPRIRNNADNQFGATDFISNSSQQPKPVKPMDVSEVSADSKIKTPLHSALSMVDKPVHQPISSEIKNPPARELTNPFLDPFLDPSRPIVDPSLPMIDQNSQAITPKRLPRTNTQPKNPIRIEPAQTPNQSAQTKLEYTTKSGDSFWSIAQSVYNDGRYFRALYKFNEPQVPDFDLLKSGTTIGTPARADLIKLWPDLCPATETSQADDSETKTFSGNSRVYVTRHGDTVFDIARQRLGQASRYAEILKLNRMWLGQDVSHLTPLDDGVRLVMPE